MRQVKALSAILVVTGLVLVSVGPATADMHPAAGMYAGSGPAEIVNEHDRCYYRGPMELAFYGPTTAEGTWAVDILLAWTPFTDCVGTSVGFGWWPGPTPRYLEGSPETGFYGEGTDNLYGTTSATIDWTFESGPLGPETEWTLRTESHSSGHVSTFIWSGVVNLTGADV